MTKQDFTEQVEETKVKLQAIFAREDMELLEKGEIPESMLEDVNGGLSEVAQSFADWGESILDVGYIYIRRKRCIC